jgi:hypothetical protein
MVRWHHPGDDIDQGRFSSSIFTDQRMDFTNRAAKRNVIQRQNAGKRFGNIFQFAAG